MMVISLNGEASSTSFEALLERLLRSLRTSASRNPLRISAMQGSRMERLAFDILCSESRGTEFEGSIELVSGQRFPDIVAGSYYGLEVKTSTSGGWRSIGGSVAEGSRLPSIERIYLLFGKLSSPVDFRCRPYEECLSGIAVTHSSRYQVDMDLMAGDTIFDRLKISYDELRNQNDPVSTVVDYLRGQLKPGETTWWLSTNESRTTNPTVRLWFTLSRDEADILRLKGYCLFPELLSSEQTKFHRFLLWLATEEGVIVGNARDQYTAGGRVRIEYQSKLYEIPQVVNRLIVNRNKIRLLLGEFDLEVLEEYWCCRVLRDRYLTWVDLVSEKSSQISDFPVKEFLLNG